MRRRAPGDDELRDEIEFHLSEERDDLEDDGRTPDEARWEARRRFGNAALVRESLGDVWAARWVQEAVQDARFGVRTFFRNRLFTAVVLLTLALGIGATTAIFSVVNSVVLEPLPFRDAGRLYQINTVYPDGTAYPLSAPDFMSVRRQSRVLEQVEAYYTDRYTLLGEGEPREISATSISDGLFELLGLPMAIGRGFLPEEHGVGRGRVAVLDHGFWQNAFGGSPAVLGRTVSLTGEPYTVVGILGPGARLPNHPDVYIPIEYGATFSAETAQARRGEFLWVVGRGMADAAPDRLQDELRDIGARLQREFPGTNEGLSFGATPLREVVLGDVQRPLLLLLGAVGFVLLVACANVASSLLARSSARQGELAVRAALGGGRGRLARQLLTEALVLGLAGGLAGVGIAVGVARLLTTTAALEVPRLDEVRVDGTVMVFALALTLVTALIFGTVPALRAADTRLWRGLREEPRGGRRGHRARAILVVVEMAVAVVLLMGAGLLIRSVLELTRVDVGFRPGQAAAFRLMNVPGDTPERARSRVEEILARLRTLPGVVSAGATTTLPLRGRGAVISFEVIDAPPPPANVNREILVAAVTAGYFEAIGGRLLDGRLITDRDQDGTPRVAVINRAALPRWFPDGQPLGRRVRVGGEFEIVGVVADARQDDPSRPAAPQLFVPQAQVGWGSGSLQFVMRTRGDAVALAPLVRAEMQALDSTLAVADFTPLQDLVTTSIARPRQLAGLMSVFAAVALALAAGGVFGVMSFSVAQRTREICIRTALGARVADTSRLIVGRAVALATVGVALGLAGALALGRLVQSELFNVPLLDPLVLSGVVLLLLASAVLASVLPARRAAVLDVAGVLRES